MLGENILVRSLSIPSIEDQYGNLWQYHSRSDRHSKIACWGVLLDVLRSCPLMRTHAARGLIAFGINHPMTDFITKREKNLDLVVCIPSGSGTSQGIQSFADLRSRYAISLTMADQVEVNALPILEQKPVGDVLLALEAKACMTAHHKAAPRLFDELTSAAQCINGSAPSAVAVGLVLINVAESFVSSDLNKFPLSDRPAVVSANGQPAAFRKALGTVRQLSVRGYANERGYDAVGATMISAKNDGTTMHLAPRPSALEPSDPLQYGMMVRRIAGLYDTRFQNR